MRTIVFAASLLGCRAQPPIQTLPSTPQTSGELCRAQGFDFSFDDRSLHEASAPTMCGRGPGTPCEREQRFCAGQVLVRCERGKLADLDCSEWCRHSDPVMTPLSVDGTCGAPHGVAECVCCGTGEPPCPGESTPMRSVPLSPSP